MNTVRITHPDLGRVREVPASAVAHWARAGWRQVAEDEQDPAAPPTPTAAPRRRKEEEGES